MTTHVTILCLHQTQVVDVAVVAVIWSGRKRVDVVAQLQKSSRNYNIASMSLIFFELKYFYSQWHTVINSFFPGSLSYV